MKAITLLERSGYTRRQISDGIGVGVPALAMYRRGDRFPSRKAFQRIVEMAEARGLLLLARDFLQNGDKDD